MMGVISGQAVWNEWDLYSELKRSHPDIMGYESFEYRKNVKGGVQMKLILFPRNLIGVMNLYYYERAANSSPIQCFQQTPAQGKKGYYSDARLKSDKLYKTLPGGHCNDALRHLLHWYTFGAGFKYNKHGYKGLA
jgi:hypothetical protein